MEVLYFIRKFFNQGISYMGKPFETKIIELNSFLVELQYSQKTGKEEFCFKYLDQSKIIINIHDNKIYNYDINIDFMKDGSSSAGYNNHKELIEYKESCEFKKVDKKEFLEARQELMELAKPYFKLNFDFNTQKEFHLKNETSQYFYNCDLHIFKEIKKEGINPILDSNFSFFISKEADEFGHISLISEYGHHVNFKEARRYNRLKFSRILSKRNFNRFYKTLMKIFETKQYLDYDAIEQKKQDYRITVLNI